MVLTKDVQAILDGTKKAEPLFIRVNAGDCINFSLTNMAPNWTGGDAFQQLTQTNMAGGHVHLVKFDVTASDGAANGFNYEDGSLSPGDVQHRIAAIRAFYNCGAVVNPPNCPGPAQAHPDFGPGPNGAWRGAQETLQRWWVDPVLRGGGRTTPLGTVFTHDHFGPSTHQQVGLYAGLVPEDSNTTWRDPETGTVFGTRPDGGPTSWRADILYAQPDTNRSFREFNLQLQDFTLAYGREGFIGNIGRVPPINPPGRTRWGSPTSSVRPSCGTAGLRGCAPSASTCRRARRSSPRTTRG